MIDLTPLDVRNKRGDFKRAMRGYEPHEVDLFLEMVADRLEALVRENLQLRERAATLQTQVTAQTDREQAVQDALVTAQELRADIRAQSQREADHAIREAEIEARRMIAEADETVRDRLRGIERQLDQATRSLEELERRRARFLNEFKGLLERELDVVQVEESRAPLEARAIDLDLGPSPLPTTPGPRGWDDEPPESPASASPAESARPEATASTDALEASEAPRDDLVPLGGVSGAIAAGATAPGTGAVSDTGPVADVTPPGASAASEGAGSAENEGGSELVDERSSGMVDEGAAELAAPTAPLASDDPETPGERDLSVAMDVDALRPTDTATGMPEPEVFASEAEAYDEARYGPRPDPTVLPVDVADLGPEADAVRPPPPMPPLDGEPSALELELMAGAGDESGQEGSDADRFAGIPDLETVLAEAGVDDVPAPPEEIAPPPVHPDDPILLFDPDDEDPYRR